MRLRCRCYGFFPSQLVLILATLYGTGGETGCTFPSRWHGRWYQGSASGGRDIQITQSLFLPIGRCYENVSNKYLLEQKSGPDEGSTTCYRCLVITERHDNILQFKQSFCNPTERSIDLLCGTTGIKGDFPLETLVREPSPPIPCPFQGAYTFTYDNLTGICDQPRSQISGCAKDSRLKYHFKHCDGFEDTNNIDVNLECLASWKDGSNYLYGKFNVGSGSSSNKQFIYRCFTYQTSGSNVNLMSSADATCYGLRDAPSLTMALSKDGRWPITECQFPDWFTGTVWRDLSYTWQYKTENDGITIRVQHSSNPGLSMDTVRALRCHKIKSLAEHFFEGISYTSQACHSQYQCIRFIRKQNNIVEIQTGTLTNMYGDEDACDIRNTRNVSRSILIPLEAAAVLCPIVNSLHIETVSSPLCRLSIQTGCEKQYTDKLAVEICENSAVQRLECLGSFTEKDQTYVITKLPGEQPISANCFTIKENPDNIKLTLDRACNSESPLILSRPIQYSFRRTSGSCDNQQISDTATVTKNPDRSNKTSDGDSSKNNKSGGCRTIESWSGSLVVLWTLTLMMQTIT